MAENLRQVLLRRPSDGGHFEDVFWIQVSLAKVGKRLLSEDDGHVWTVVELYNVRAFEDVEQQRQTWKRFSEVLK